MVDRPQQIPLSLSHHPDYGRISFVAGPSNSAALALIERWPDWPSKVVVLAGPAGSGKTHLAHIWSERAGAQILDAREIASGPPPAFDANIALEDIEAAPGAETALFHLINGLGEAGASLLLTSREPVSAWNVGLADLRSRLRRATPALLDPPDDDLLRKLLVKLFADRQLIVDKAVIEYLLARMERSLSAAVGIVDRLDREALAVGRSITRPMAARILADGQAETTEFADPQ